MQSLKAQAHIGDDGILKLELPVDVVNTDVELVIVMQSVTRSVPDAFDKKTAQAFFEQSREEARKNGWPDGFFEKFYGALADDPIERGPQGEFEVRDEIL